MQAGRRCALRPQGDDRFVIFLDEGEGLGQFTDRLRMQRQERLSLLDHVAGQTGRPPLISEAESLALEPKSAPQGSGWWITGDRSWIMDHG